MPAPPAYPLAEIYLNPGELAFAESPCRLRTILGSCVAVVVWDPVGKRGGMCHYLLPEAPEGQHFTKYGDVAIPTLLKKFKNAGSHLHNLRAVIAGGSLSFNSDTVFFVGERNAALAESMLEHFHIKVVQKETGGERGRRVFLDCSTGEVGVSFIPHSDLSRLKII